MLYMVVFLSFCLPISKKAVPLQRVFHSIRFKVNKGWSKALLLFFCPYLTCRDLLPLTNPSNLKNMLRNIFLPQNICRFTKNPYLCTVFFIVLDLRLTKVGARRCSFFFCPYVSLTFHRQLLHPFLVVTPTAWNHQADN